MSFHREAVLGDIHKVYDQLYADAATRDADTTWNTDTTNVGKVIRVDDIGALYVLMSEAPLWKEITSVGNDTFLELTDVDPSSYSGQAGKHVKVNDGETGLDFGQSLRTTDSVIFDEVHTTSVLSTDGIVVTIAKAVGTDVGVNGGGIILKGATDKTILWNDTDDSWDFNQIGKFEVTLSVGSAAAPALDTSLDLKATDQAMALNRLNTTNRDAITAFAGHFVYNTSTSVPEFYNGSSWVSLAAGVGDVVGPASSVDNELVRFDGASGKLLQGGTVPIYFNDSGFLGFDQSTIGSPIHIADSLANKQLITLNQINGDGFQFRGFGYLNNIMRAQLGNPADDFMIYVGGPGSIEKPIAAFNGSSDFIFGSDLTSGHAVDSDTLFQIEPDSDAGLKVKSAGDARIFLHDTTAGTNLKQYNLVSADGIFRLFQSNDDLATGDSIMSFVGGKMNVGPDLLTDGETADVNATMQVTSTGITSLKVKGDVAGRIVLEDTGALADHKQVNLTSVSAEYKVAVINDALSVGTDLTVLNLQSGDYTVKKGQIYDQRGPTGSLVDTRVWGTATDVEEIWQEEDFGVATLGVITLSNNATYVIMAPITLTSQLKIPTGASVQFLTTNRSKNQITYTNLTLAMFQGLNIGTLALMDIVIDGNSTGTLLDIDGGVLSFKFPDFNAWSAMGTVENLVDFFAPGLFIDTSTGLNMINCASCTIVDTLILISNSGSAAFVISGASSGDLQFYNNILDASNDNNSMVNIDGGTYPSTNTVNLGGNNIVNGVMFHASSIEHDDTRVISRGNKGASDSTATADLSANDQAGVQTPLNQNIVQRVIATFSEHHAERFNTDAAGTAEYIGLDEATIEVSMSIFGTMSSGTNISGKFYLVHGNTLNTITALADQGGGVIRATTSLPHGYTTGDRIIIEDTTSNDGQYAVTVIDTTHYDFVDTFTGTTTGTHARVELTHKASNSFSGADLNTVLIAQVKMETNAFLYLGVENIDSAAEWETQDIQQIYSVV
jgi:hypothetical protein